MNFETLKTETIAEIAAWQRTGDRVASLMEDRDELLKESQDLMTEILDLASQLSAQKTNLSVILASLPGELSKLEQAIEGLPQRVEQAGRDLTDLADGTWGQLDAAVQNTTEAMREDSAQIFGEAESALQTEAGELRDFLEENILESLQEHCAETLDSVTETCSELVESVDERFTVLVETAHEKTDELMEQLDFFGENWTKNVTEVKDAYEKLVEEITTLGEDVTTLTEGIDAALATTGVGMNAATGTLDDIRSVMMDVV